MDEIDYFPKRDKFKVKKDVGSDWNKLKKQKTTQPGKACLLYTSDAADE